MNPGSAAEPMPDAFERPLVSIVMPVRNEERYIVRAIEGVMEQDYPADRIELLVVDGLSTDCTRELVQEMQRRHPNIRLIDNPGRIVPSGFNTALDHASGDVVLRMDGHCEYPPNYVDQVVRFREENRCDNFGGVLDPIGNTWTQRAICAAYRSPVGIGGAALRGHSGADVVQEVDAVHGGCWLISRLREVGGMDEAMVRNQDDELSFRLRKRGGRIMQSTSLRVRYHVRDSFRQLFRQFAQYGYWKVRVIQKHPQQSSVRHYVPGCFLLLTLLLAFLGCFLPECRVMLGVLWALYLATLLLVSAVQLAIGRGLSLLPGAVLALLAMHVGYGAGFLLGWARLVYGPLPTDRLFEGITR